MHFNSIFASSLLLVSSALAQGQQDPSGNSGGMNMGSTQGNAADGESSQSMMPTVMGLPPRTTSTITSTMMSVSEAAATPTDGAGTKVHVVKVSDASAGLFFSPDNIQAAKGDMVQFQFYPRNHSVVQSTFDKPCEPIANGQPGSQGFFSGFMPVSQSSTMQPTFSILVNDTRPIWFYCSQGRHCQQGMVGVINAPANNSSRTLESYKALAARASQNLSPGQVSGGSTNGSTSGSGTGSGSGASGATTLTSTASSTATGAASNSSNSTTGPGASPTTGGVGSVRLDGGRQMLSTAAAVGFAALAMGLLM